MKHGTGCWLLFALSSCTTAGVGYEATATPAAIAFNPPRRTAEASAMVAKDDEHVATTPSEGRQVIYVAGLRLVVVKVTEAANAVQSFAREAGGYVQESETNSITIRVPVDRFEALLARIAGLGEVVERSIRSNDVTEQMFDIELRLDNLRKARERLLSHLERSERLEDTLKIEAELTRVTGEIESFEGRLRFMQAQVAMSTIHVSFDAQAPQSPADTDVLGLPFNWVARLGDGLVAGVVEGRPRKASFFERLFGSGPDFTSPPEFIRYYSDERLVEELSADGVRIKVQTHDNYDNGASSFWSALARRALVSGRAVAVTREERLGDGRHLIVGAREVAGRAHGYMLLMVRTNDRIYTFEAWGPESEFQAREAALLESARSLER